MVKNTYCVIMAGGVGARFWPQSRKTKPKQFLDILGTGKSFIRSTFERFLPLVPVRLAFHLLLKQFLAYSILFYHTLEYKKDNNIMPQPS